jgi:hypothetical protein
LNLERGKRLHLREKRQQPMDKRGGYTLERKDKSQGWKLEGDVEVWAYKREEGRLEVEVLKDKMLIVIVLVGNLRLWGREIRDLFLVQRKKRFYIWVV